jgi:hypothetical protein
MSGSRPEFCGRPWAGGLVLALLIAAASVGSSRAEEPKAAASGATETSAAPESTAATSAPTSAPSGVPAKAAAASPTVEAVTPARKPAGARSGAAPTATPTAATKSTRMPARPAASTPALTRVATPGNPAPSPATVHESHVTYHYNALGRRDPFQALVGGAFLGMDEGGDAPPDVGGLRVVGIVWGTQDKFALVEDPRGNSMVLRQGDKVMNGVVETLTRDAVNIRITADGQTQTVAIPLIRKENKE